MPFESDLMMEDCVILEGLHMMEEALMEYKPLSMFDECFTEAFGSKKKKEEEKKAAEAKAAELKAQEEKNKQAQDKGVSGFKKVIDGLLTMCRKIIEMISNFLDEKLMDKKEKEAYQKFKAACKEDPSLANKKVTVRDYRKVQAEYKKLMDECESEIQACKEDPSHPIDAITQKCKNFLKNNGKGIAVSMGAASAINMGGVNRQFAKLMRNIMHSDEEILQSMQKSMGAKQFKNFDKDLKSLGHRLSLKRTKMWLTQSLYKDMTSAMVGPVNDVMEMISGKFTAFGSQGRMRKQLFDNKDTGKTLRTAGELGLDIFAHGVVGGAKDKLGYIGKKAILPKKTAREGIYGQTVIGDVGNEFKNAMHPSGKHGIKDSALAKGVKGAGAALKSGAGKLKKAIGK